MTRIVTVVAAAGAVAMFLVQPATASANCLGAPLLKPIAYQSGSGFAGQVFPRSPFEPTVREQREADRERVTVD